MASHDHHVHDHPGHPARGGGAAHAGHAHAPKDFGTAFAIGVLLNAAFVVAELTAHLVHPARFPGDDWLRGICRQLRTHHAIAHATIQARDRAARQRMPRREPHGPPGGATGLAFSPPGGAPQPAASAPRSHPARP